MWQNISRLLIGFILTLEVTCLSSFTAGANFDGKSARELTAVSDSLKRAVDQQEIAGASCLVLHEGNVVYRNAFGYADLESKRKFTTEELIPIASISKPFLASVVMRLIDQGKLNLDDPVEKYLSEFKGIKVRGLSTKTNQMTIRHLLSHTAGFWGNKDITPKKLDLIRNFERPLYDAVQRMAEYDLIYEPGTKWVYSGSGYCVAGRVLEVALGQSIERISQETLFRPLGLDKTTFLPSSKQLESIPNRYLRIDGKLTKQPAMTKANNLKFVLPGGSLFTSLDNLGTFGQMHLDNGVYGGKQILTEDSVAEMRRLQSPQTSNRSYGLGWFRDDIADNGLADLTYHGGSLGGHFRVDRKRGLVCIFLVHQTGSQVQRLKNEIVKKINDVFPLRQEQ